MFLVLVSTLILSSRSVWTTIPLTSKELGSLYKERSHSVLRASYSLPHTVLQLLLICSSCASFQGTCLVGLQEAQTFLQNFLWADFTVASLLSEHIRQSSLVTDSGLESAIFSHESLSGSDSSSFF